MFFFGKPVLYLEFPTPFSKLGALVRNIRGFHDEDDFPYLPRKLGTCTLDGLDGLDGGGFGGKIVAKCRCVDFSLGLFRSVDEESVV